MDLWVSVFLFNERQEFSLSGLGTQLVVVDVNAGKLAAKPTEVQSPLAAAKPAEVAAKPSRTACANAFPSISRAATTSSHWNITLEEVSRIGRIRAACDPVMFLFEGGHLSRPILCKSTS